MNLMIKSRLASKQGLTLVEIVVAFALISLIVVSFMSLFAYSSKANKISETSVSSTYIAKDQIEMVYSLSKTGNLAAGINNITAVQGFTSLSAVDKLYGKVVNGRYVTIRLTESGNLTKVLVNVYNDNTLAKLEAKMETLLSWMN